MRLLDERNLDIGVRRIYNSGPTHKLNRSWNTVGMTGTQLIYLSTVTYDAYANYQFNLMRISTLPSLTSLMNTMLIQWRLA